MILLASILLYFFTLYNFDRNSNYQVVEWRFVLTLNLLYLKSFLFLYFLYLCNICI